MAFKGISERLRRYREISQTSTGGFGKKLSYKPEVVDNDLIASIKSLMANRSGKKLVNERIIVIDRSLHKLLNSGVAFETTATISALIKAHKDLMTPNAYRKLMGTMATAWAYQYVRASSAPSQETAFKEFKSALTNFHDDSKDILGGVQSDIEKMIDNSLRVNGISAESKLLRKLRNAIIARFGEIEIEVAQIEQKRIEALAKKLASMQYHCEYGTPEAVLEDFESVNSRVDSHPAFCALDTLIFESDGYYSEAILCYLAGNVRNIDYLRDLLTEIHDQEIDPKPTRYTREQIKDATRRIVASLLCYPLSDNEKSSEVLNVCVERTSSIGVATLLLDLELVDPEVVWKNMIAGKEVNTSKTISNDGVIDKLLELFPTVQGIIPEPKVVELTA